jgi:hypothetical protein
MNSATRSSALSVTATLLALTGCGARSSAQTAADVAGAEASGARDVTEARSAAAIRTANVRRPLNNAELDVAHEGVEAAWSVEIARAQADHKVAIERCEASAAEARRNCKARADTILAAAKANADMTKAANDPKA